MQFVFFLKFKLGNFMFLPTPTLLDFNNYIVQDLWNMY